MKPGQWWTKSWNVAVGCDMTLPCAAHCWARRQAHMHAKHPNPAIAAKYAGITDDAGRWTGKVRLWEPELEAPLHWRKPQVVAVSLMGDLFLLPNAEIDRIYAVMALCPQHTFMLLTKRAERRSRWYTEHTEWSAPVGGTCIEIDREWEHWMSSHEPFDSPQPWPLPNVIETISFSTQAELDERWPLLARTPAARRGLHLEPLLGRLTIEPLVCRDYRHGTPHALARADWVCVGGETGPGARPTHLDWVRSIRDQCQAARVPFYFKQRGEFTWDHPPAFKGEWGIVERDGDYCRFTTRWINSPGHYTDDAEYVWRVGHKSAGRLLDGREWNELPW